MTWGHLGRARWQRARLLHALLALALWHPSVLARAQPAPRAGLGLNWVRLPGAESCVASVDLMNRIEQRAGRIIFVRTGEAVLTIDGYVRPAAHEAPGWLVTFEVSDAEGNVLGRRELDALQGSDCEIVAGAAELIVELTLDPDGVLGAGIPLTTATQQLLDEQLRGEPSELDPSTLPKGKQAAWRQTSTVEAGPAPNTASDEAETQPETEPPARTRLLDEPFALDLSGVAMLGTLPSLAPGIALNLSFSVVGSWTVELGLLTLAEQTARAPAFAGRGRTILGHDSLALLVCPPRFWRFVEVCGGAEYGRQSYSAAGFSSLQPAQSRELFNMLARATLRVDVFSTVFVRASLGLIVPLVRHEYFYDSHAGDQPLFRTAPVGGRAELGLGLYI